MICPLYNNSEKAVHGLRCTAPVCSPLVDCGGSLSSGKCTVPAFMWRVLVVKGGLTLRAPESPLAPSSGRFIQPELIPVSPVGSPALR